MCIRDRTLPAHVHLGYVTEEELTAEEKAQVIHAIPEEYQNEDTFYLVYKMCIRDRY